MYVHFSIIFHFYFVSLCKRKNWFKIFGSYVVNTWMILKHIDRCEDRISYICHVGNIFRYTRNLKFRNNINKVAIKIWHSLLSLDTHFSVSLRMILSSFQHFIEKSGETIFQIFWMTKLLKYSFLVVLSSFLQKICCKFTKIVLLYFNTSSWNLVLKKPCNLDLFIVSLCNSKKMLHLLEAW